MYIPRLLVAALLTAALARTAQATPSTVIWIPSADVQSFLVPHLNSDVYLRVRDEPDGSRKSPLYLFGPTIGVLPWEKVQMEVGFDLMFQGFAEADRYPIYFHAKLGTPEGSMFRWSPAIAGGIYNLGVKSEVTSQDIVYGIVGRTFPVIGRLEVGYFRANPNSLFPDGDGHVSNHGLLASWDRSMKEITPRLWLAVDYQGSSSWLGAVSFGAAWSFTDNVSMILGYDLYTNRSARRTLTGDVIVPGRDTITVQLDINLDRLVKRRTAPASQVALAQ